MMSLLRLDGALVSTVGVCALRISCDHPFDGRLENEATSSLLRWLAPVVLWSSVIMIGLDTPDPINLPVWSVMVKWTLNPTFSL